MQTLHIMERVFRQGMLDELQLNPSVVHALFPCLDQLTRIHIHFLDQLLLRRDNSLQPGSGHNFTIHQLGDILLEQVTCTQIPGVVFEVSGDQVFKMLSERQKHSTGRGGALNQGGSRR